MRNFLKPIFVMAALAITMAFAATSAKADIVTFNTTGTFSSTGTNTVTFGTGLNTTTLTFNGAAGNVVNTPSGSSFGDFTVLSTGTGANTLSGNFTLLFTVTSPAGSAGTSDPATGVLSGTLAINQSNQAILTFTDPTGTVGGFTFTVNQPGTVIRLVPTTTGAGGGAIAGNTTLQGDVTGSAVPEPATMVLLGTGLMGIGATVRRRRKASREA